MNNQTAAVFLDGTLTEGSDPAMYDVGKLKESAVNKMDALHASYRIIIVSPLLNTNRGVRIVTMWLYDNKIPFDDLWMGSGLPYADVWVHDDAVKL